MVFKAQLPELTDLCKIARAVKSYPATTEQVVKAAQDIGYESSVAEFINLFSHDDRQMFESRADFYTRAAELAMLICEESEQPREVLRSPQN
jgi:hypothetical protein